MRYSRVGLLIALTGLMGGGAAGCGDDGFECGDGTVEMDGTCVPTDEVCGAGTTYDMATGTCLPDGGLECGEGTIAMGDECVADLGCGTGTTQMGNECVPDGSVICTGNTVFDADSGTCVVDESACAEGTVFVVEAGECIPFDDSLVADFTETTEPNDPAFSDTAMISPFELPAVGDSITLGGCVEPTDFDEDGFTDADLDFFAFEVSEPTTLRIQTDGVGGLAAGALIFRVDDLIVTHAVVDNTNDGAEKTIFLPRAGQYAIAVSDSRNLVPFLLGETALPAGGDGACYFVQVTGAELPAASATLTLDNPRVGPFQDDPIVYEIDSAMTQLFFASLDELLDDEPVDFITLDGAMSAMSGDEYLGTVGAPFEVGTGTVTIVLETVFNLSLDPIESQLTITGQPVQNFPESGDVTLTKASDEVNTVADLEYIAFDGVAGDVAHLAFDSTDSLFPVVISPGGTLSFPCPAACSASDDDYLLTDSGRYLFGFFNEDVAVGDDYTVSVSRAMTTPTTLTVGTPAAGALDTDDSAWFSLPASAADWLEYTLTDLVDMTEGVVRFYATTEPAFGILGLEVPQADGEAADPSFQRVYLGEADTFLIEVTDPDTVDGTETFSLGVANVAFTDLGTVSEATPLSRAGESLTAGDPAIYLVRAAEGTTVDIDVAPADPVDVAVTTHDEFDGTAVDTIDDAGVAGTENIVRILGGEGIIIFSVADTVAGGGTFDLNVNATDPVEYAAAAAAATFTDICPSGGGAGTLVDDYLDNDDGWSGRITMPVPFIFYGFEQTQLFVSSNGRIQFGDTSPGDGYFPTRPFFGTAAGNQTLFPFPDDLIESETCVYHDATAGQYIIQMTANPYSFDGSDTRLIRFQVILDGADQSVTYVYDTTQDVTSSIAEDSIAIQGPAPSIGTEFTTILGAGESVTFTPL
ncbi:MAG: hypothetical protein JJ863_22380 [Deltaproteobacteria bacterium]|nr:hypothetical protein [Deltaproteobacteria bacterium]